jgi:hypothetical protein
VGELGLGTWRYVKVRKDEFERVQPASLAELALLEPRRLPGVP